jgi:cytochrome bd-type quinol oxidase subunit 1
MVAETVTGLVVPGAVNPVPWIVYHRMKVEQAATANTGVWFTFVVFVLYAALGVTTVLVLRRMSRRFRRGRFRRRRHAVRTTTGRGVG